MPRRYRRYAPGQVDAVAAHLAVNGSSPRRQLASDKAVSAQDVSPVRCDLRVRGPRYRILLHAGRGAEPSRHEVESLDVGCRGDDDSAHLQRAENGEVGCHRHDVVFGFGDEHEVGGLQALPHRNAECRDDPGGIGRGRHRRLGREIHHQRRVRSTVDVQPTAARPELDAVGVRVYVLEDLRGGREGGMTAQVHSTAGVNHRR